MGGLLSKTVKKEVKNEMDREYITAVVFILLAICGGIGLVYMTFTRDRMVVQFATVTVPSNGLIFKDGIIESPALILEINESDFLTYAKSYSSTVYGYRNQFYTFTKT